MLTKERETGLEPVTLSFFIARAVLLPDPPSGEGA
jgi:hypothetical protein